MSDLMREEFEAWWSSTPILGENKRTIAEKAWQASREFLVIELPIIQECCSDGGESSKWMDPEDVIKSIHAAGVKTR